MYLRYECYILSMFSMLNDDNNNNPSVVRPQSYISYALVGKFFSLSDTYLSLSIYTYRYNNPKNGVQIQNTLNGQSNAIRMGWRAGTKKKGE